MRDVEVGRRMGGLVRALRHKLKMTQEEFAHELGITVGTVNRWENSHYRPSNLAMTVLRNLAQRRGVSVGAIGKPPARYPSSVRI